MIRITIGIYLPFSYFASLTQLEKVEYYSSGELRARGLTDNGNKFGEWIYFYPSGKKSAIGNFDQGMLHGVSSIFYPTEIQGKEIWKTRQLQDSAWYYHPSGSLHRKGVFENSRYANTWIHYLEDGVTERIVHYQDGQPNGATKVNNNNGFLIQEGEYKNGLEHSSWKFYNAEGVLEYSGHYERGKPTGNGFEYNRGKQKMYKRY